MKIVDVRTHVVLDPGLNPDATSSAQDSIVVEIETDAGLVGVGETDLNAWIARACIEAPGTHTMDRGLRAMLIGRDATSPEALWEDLYVGSAMSGRRGAVVHALGAIDMALWDLAGKVAGVPCWRLWGDPVRDHLTPYASLQPEVDTFEAYVESMVRWAQTACAIGFTAVKLEATFSGPYVHRGLVGADERVVDVVRAVRDAVGGGPAILVDVQYAFDSVERALRTATALAELDVFFLETPLWADDLDGYAQLAESSPVRIAAGEWLATRHEFVDLMDRGRVHVAQPDVGRVGGFTEALRVCSLAAERGRLIVPHAWKTGISTAAAAHLAMVTPHMPFFEFLPPALCESRLRQELVREELSFDQGRLSPPSLPGLGIELDPAALAEFSAAAEALAT
jgi:L-alanine-DL-glutamate epimerase-like enolase superfamily enzyme